MIKFFNNIRSTLIDEGNMKRYLIYAIGEIVLVVLGILIALQINNWNTERLNRHIEKDYLSEIKVNMMADKLAIKRILEFNDAKVMAIDSVLNLFSVATSSEDYMSKLVIQVNYLSQYDLFIPIRTSYDNMISSSNIDIIKNKDLRKQISEYYSAMGVENSTQEGTKIHTRNFGEDLIPKVIGDKKVQQLVGISLDFNDNRVINIHKDRTVIANLIEMKTNTLAQTLEVKNTDAQINSIISIIDQELK